MSTMTNAIAAWLLTYAVHSTLLLGAAVIVLRRKRSAASRDLIWKAAAFGALLSSALQSVVVRDQRVEPLAGRWEIPSVESAAEPHRAAGRDIPADAHAVAKAANQNVPSALPTTAPAEAPSSLPIAAPGRREFTVRLPNWQTALVALWIGGVMVSLFGLSRRYARARRRFARRFDASDPEILAAVNVLSERIGLQRRVRVTRCGAVHSPVALGRSEICLPEALLRVLPAQQRTGMLAHELAHLDRNDPIWLAAFGWLECLMFFQPLNRIARKGFQEAAEHLCDQYALQHTESPIALAQCLAEVARWLRGESDPLPYPTMGESLSPLVDRVQRVLNGVREPITTTLRARWSAVGGVLAFAVMAPVVTDFPIIAQRSSTSNPAQQETDPISNAVRQMTDGVVRFSFSTRPSICGTGQEKDGTRMFALKPDGSWQPAGRADLMVLYVWDRGQLMRNDLGVDGKWTTPCNPGPARIDLTVRNGHVQAVDLSVADPAPRLAPPVSDLGIVGAEIALRYLTELAQQGTEVGRRALIAASLSPRHNAALSVAAPSAMSVNQATPGSPQPISGFPADKLSVLQDKLRPLSERLRVLDHLRDDRDGVMMLLRVYDSVPDRAMRVELIDWLSQRENAQVREKLEAIVRDAVVLEEQQAALRALERSSDTEARAFAARYRQKQQSLRDDIVNAQVYNFTFPGAAQGDLARRIAAAPHGIVHVTYKARPEACGSGVDEDGAGMFALLPTSDWHPAGERDQAALYSFDRDDFSRLSLSPNPSWTDKCVNGPVHLLLDVRDGAVTNLRIAIGPAPRGVRITNEIGGPLSGPEAANYLIELAGRADQTIATNAILAAVMAEGNPLLYDKLIRIAADPSRPERVRQSALHWVALDPAPGASEAIRRNADRLPRDTGSRSPLSESPAALGDHNARLGSVEGMSLDVVLRIVLDERQPLDTRKKAIKWAEDKDISPDALAGLYDHLQNREMRLFLVQFLADCDDESTAQKLISIADRDRDNEIRQAARMSLSRHQNAVARAYRR